MAFDAFLKLDGIKGESQVKGFEDQIQIESFHWGVSNNVTFLSGGGAGAGKASAQDLLLTADSSAASPELFIACASGDNIKEGLLTLRSAAGESQTPFATVKVTNVFVVAYDQAGVGESGNPMDEFALRYAKMEFTYNGVKEAFDFLTSKKL